MQNAPQQPRINKSVRYYHRRDNTLWLPRKARLIIADDMHKKQERCDKHIYLHAWVVQCDLLAPAFTHNDFIIFIQCKSAEAWLPVGTNNWQLWMIN